MLKNTAESPRLLWHETLRYYSYLLSNDSDSLGSTAW